MNEPTTQETQPSAALPFADLDRQVAFDIMLNYLRRQGRPATTPKGGCRYRIDGLKCAVGALIPDALYEERFDEYTSLDEIGTLFGATPSFIDFLRDCRSLLHDQPASHTLRGYGDFLAHVEDGAQRIAANYNLFYTPPAKAIADA